MKKFKVEIVRTDEYEIVIDENVWNEEALKDWSKSFWQTDTLNDLSESLAHAIMQGGSNQGFIEGFGYVKIFYPDGTLKTQFDGLKKVEESQYTAGISLKLLSEAEDFSYETCEIRNKKGGEDV